MAFPLDGDPRVWTIGDLTRRASLAVVRDFRGPVWVVGELAKIDERRGHRWLELVDRGGGREGRDSHLDAFCSATRWQRVDRKLAEAGFGLQAGQRLTIAGSLDIGDRGRLTLTVEDVDIAALVGDRLRDRQRLVARLIADDLFDANRRLPLTPLPLRVGLVASAGSDGHRDVVRRLERSGFAFDITLRSIPVEGPAAPRALGAALVTLGPADVDVVVVVRGGGAKASLDVFDSAIVAHAIATAAVPVWTGIGHAGDRTVADEVAHRCFATPTALGHALVTAVTSAWDEVDQAVARIAGLVDQRLDASAGAVDDRWLAVRRLVGHQLALHEHHRAQASSDLWRAMARRLDGASDDLTIAARSIRASGTVELRDAQRRGGALAHDTVAAARRRCADSTADLVAGAGSLAASVAGALRSADEPLDRLGLGLTRARADAVLDAGRATLASGSTRTGRAVRRRLAAESDRSAGRRAVLEAYDPRRQLARGWTLTHTADGLLLRRVADVAPGDTLVTTFVGGTATSSVTEVTGVNEDEAG